MPKKPNENTNVDIPPKQPQLIDNEMLDQQNGKKLDNEEPGHLEQNNVEEERVFLSKDTGKSITVFLLSENSHFLGTYYSQASFCKIDDMS